MAWRTLASAPLEMWNAVKLTAGAAAVLITRRKEKEQGLEELVREAEVQPRSTASGPGNHTHVDKAREKWREARNDMPEVRHHCIVSKSDNTHTGRH